MEFYDTSVIPKGMTHLPIYSKYSEKRVLIPTRLANNRIIEECESSRISI